MAVQAFSVGKTGKAKNNNYIGSQNTEIYIWFTSKN